VISAALLDSYSAIWQLIYAGADGINNPADYNKSAARMVTMSPATTSSGHNATIAQKVAARCRRWHRLG
jgi:hypothetical protein